MKNISIKIFGIITALPGFYYLISDFRGHLLTISDIFNRSTHSEYMFWWSTIITLILIIILILRIISGYGLFKLKSWSKKLSIAVLSIDLVVRFAGFINMWTYYDRHPEALKILEEFEKSVASGQTQNYMTVSIIPSYVIAGVCIITIIFLLLTDFSRLEKSKHNMSLNADG